MDINTWLIKFKNSWETKKVSEVLSLFSIDVSYFETPFKKLEDFKDLEKEWSVILDQNNIKLDYTIYSESGSKYTVQWDLYYISKDGREKFLKGIYLIALNKDGLCTEFTQYGEVK